MAGYYINQRQLLAELATAEPTLRKEADRIMKDEFFQPAVDAMKDEFENHKVTLEIQGGRDAENITETLGGFREAKDDDSPPNLFSFIGFDAGSNPTMEIEKRLDPRHPDGPKLVYKGMDRSSRMEFRYEISAPNEEKIYDATPVPWGEGNVSWVQRIEQGIAGIGHFLNRIMLAKGRGLGSASGGGIQIEGDLPGRTFRATSYLSAIFNNFLRRVVGRTPQGESAARLSGRINYKE